MSAQQLAHVIVAAAKLYENSFDKAMADSMSKQTLFADYKKCYKLPLIDACEQAAGDSGFAQPAYLLLFTCWNDTLGWAEEQIHNQDKQPAETDSDEEDGSPKHNSFA